MTEKQLGIFLGALESGTYPMGQGYLYNEGTYCVLGVYAALNEGFDTMDDEDEPEGPSAAEVPDQRILMDLNDEGPLDDFRRVVAELKSCPEAYLTAAYVLGEA